MYHLVVTCSVLSTFCLGCTTLDARGPADDEASRARSIAAIDAANEYAHEHWRGMLADGVHDSFAQYYHGDHLSRNLTLTLMKGGHYSITWTGCQGVYGSGVGTWKLNDERLLLLEPLEEHGTVAEFPLRKLHVRVLNGKPILIPDDQIIQFREQGATSLTCFRDVDDVWSEWSQEP